MTAANLVAETVDFIVIGAGIAGASAAYALSAHGSVLIVEREAAPGYHTTGRSSAAFIQGYGNAAIRRLNAASAPFFHAPPAGFTSAPLTSPCGILFVAGQGDGDKLEQIDQTLTREAVDHRKLGVKEARDYIPVLSASWLSGAIYDPSAHHIDVDALLQGYLRAARASGASIWAHCDAKLIKDGTGLWRITVGDRSVLGRVVINAAGAWADQVALSAGLRPLGLRALKRTVGLTELPADINVRDWPIALDVAEQFYFKPDAGRLLFSAADEEEVEPHDAYANDLDIAIAADRLETATTLVVERVPHRWAGLRTFAPDRTIVAGFDSNDSTFFWLAGQGGYGIQTAPAMARLTAGLIADGRPPEDLASVAKHLSPRRFH